MEAELDRHPERVVLRATEPADLRAGWAGLEAMWAVTVDRIASMPPGTQDLSVEDEWSFAQTLRHLVLATDVWLGWAILRQERVPSPGRAVQRGGRPRGGFGLEVNHPVMRGGARRGPGRGHGGDYLGAVTAEGSRPQPPVGRRVATGVDCLRVIFERVAPPPLRRRDLDAIEARRA